MGGFEMLKKILHIMILLAVISLIVACGLYIIRCIPTYKEMSDKYDILKDLLGILLVIAGVGSIGVFWGIHKLIKESLEKRFEKRIEEKFSGIYGKIALVMGYLFWNSGDIERAIRHTKIALDEDLEKLDEILAKNNLAYYYAEGYLEKPIWEKRDEAIEFAEYIYGQYDTYKKDYDSPTWIETYAFVKSRFAKEDEKEKIKNEIRDLIRRKDLKGIEKDLQESLKYLNKKA